MLKKATHVTLSLCRKLLASASATTTEHKAAASCLHAFPKPMSLLSPMIIRLISSLHDLHLLILSTEKQFPCYYTRLHYLLQGFFYFSSFLSKKFLEKILCGNFVERLVENLILS